MTQDHEPSAGRWAGLRPTPSKGKIHAWKGGVMRLREVQVRTLFGIDGEGRILGTHEA